ncbi:hypothetical protein, partial [Salmonella enterica]|uniref:hypothetical protein n=1 Tax=Salmonella enterica TaxID=28901 RepID=UPI00398C2E25
LMQRLALTGSLVVGITSGITQIFGLILLVLLCGVAEWLWDGDFGSSRALGPGGGRGGVEAFARGVAPGFGLWL